MILKVGSILATSQQSSVVWDEVKVIMGKGYVEVKRKDIDKA